MPNLKPLNPNPTIRARVGSGSWAEMLRLSKTGLLFSEKAVAGVEVPACQLSANNCHNQRLFDDLGGAQHNRWRPMAVLRFTIISNFVGNCTGSFAPTSRSNNYRLCRFSIVSRVTPAYSYAPPSGHC